MCLGGGGCVCWKLTGVMLFDIYIYIYIYTYIHIYSGFLEVCQGLPHGAGEHQSHVQQPD
jgi:hypothetical protein